MGVDVLDEMRLSQNPGRRGARELGTINRHNRHTQSGCRKRAGVRGTGQPNLFRETQFSGANENREKIFYPAQLAARRPSGLVVNLHTC